MSLIGNRFRRAMRLVRPDPVILSYHRVAEVEIDPWGLAVSPARFEEHMSLLRKSRTVLPLGALIDAYRWGTLPRAPAAVTFDDGYADNLLAAKPILAKYGIPATLFLAAGSVSQDTEYWWDELARFILLSHESITHKHVNPDRLGIRKSEGPIWQWQLGRGWKAWQAPTNQREAFYLDVWAAAAARIDRDIRGHGSIEATIHICARVGCRYSDVGGTNRRPRPRRVS